MIGQRWEHAKQIFESALHVEANQRQAFLESACGSDLELRAEVESLIASYEEAGSHFLVTCAPQVLNLTVDDGTFVGSANKTIGPYRLLEEIGRGGMGQVWLAEQTAPVQRRVALKLIRAGMYDDELLKRFQLERQSLAIMDHPCIAKVHDAGATPEGQPYFVMEYVPGSPITEYCDRHRLTITERLQVFIKVCEAAQHAHQKAIIHRDLKPANILVQEIDSKPVPRIIDFGLAKAASADLDGKSLYTRLGSFVGTPGYMSPEQCDLTAHDVDTRSDVYSLGVVLYILLTGLLPFQKSADQPLEEILRQVREEDPPRPSTKVSTSREASSTTADARGTEPKQLLNLLRGDLDWITMKALEKDRARRYGTASELAADIQRYLNHEPVLARPESFTYKAAKFVRRNRTAVALASVTSAALIAGVTSTMIQAHRARVQRDFAFAQLSRAEAFNDLENFLLTDAAPSGKPFTVHELLHRAERIVERQRGTDANRLELLVSIGRQYSGDDEDGRARAVLERAYELSRSSPDHAARADVYCALASALADTGEHVRAEALFQEGLRELPEEPQYVLNRVSCLLRGREIADARGDSNLALARIQKAQKLLRESAFDSEILQLRISMDLAEAYREAGRYPDAIAGFEDASVRLTNLGRDETATASVLYNNWAMSLTQNGRPLEAEKLFRRAISIDRADNSEDAVSPLALLNYGRTLRELSRIDEASDYVKRAYLQAQQKGDEVTTNQAMIELVRIYREQHRFEQAKEMLAKVEPRLRRGLPPNHYAFAGIASERSLISLGEGDVREALRSANDAVSIDQAAIQSGGQGAGLLPIFLSRRSAAELALMRFDEALADARRAVSLLQNSMQPDTSSMNLGRAYSALGDVLAAEGNDGEAAAAFRSAADQLEKALGPEAAESRTARQLATQKLR